MAGILCTRIFWSHPHTRPSVRTALTCLEKTLTDDLHLIRNSVLKETDGLITIDAADYHPGTTAAARAWFAPRAVHYAGPLVPISSGTTSADKDAADVMQFLDAHLRSHGPKSAILVSPKSLAAIRQCSLRARGKISFGSMFWPADPAKVGAVLDILIENNVPFVSVPFHSASISSPFPDLLHL